METIFKLTYKFILTVACVMIGGAFVPVTVSAFVSITGDEFTFFECLQTASFVVWFFIFCIAVSLYFLVITSDKK